MRACLPFLALCALLAAAPGRAAEPGPRPGPQPGPQEDAYGACMAAARTAPEAAITQAEALWKAGAGTASRHCLATALLSMGRAAQAAKVFGDLARDLGQAAAADRAELHGQAGRAWLDAGDAARAEEAFTAALGLAPDDAVRLIDRAIARGARGRDFEALEDLDRAVALAPGSTDALILRAAALRRVGQAALAAEDIAAALARDPESAAAWLERGLLREDAGDREGARQAFSKAALFDPEGPSGAAAKAALRRLGAR